MAKGVKREGGSDCFFIDLKARLDDDGYRIWDTHRELL